MAESRPSLPAAESVPEIWNYRGEIIKPDLPKDYVIDRIHLPFVASLSPARELNEHVFFTITGAEGFGLVNGLGKILLAPKYESIAVERGRAVGLRKTVGAHAIQEDSYEIEFRAEYTLNPYPYTVPSEIVRTGALPAEYNHFVQLPERLFLATTPNLRSDHILAPLIVDERGQKVAEFPARAKILQVTDEHIICLSGSGNSFTDNEQGQDLIFADLKGRQKKTIHCQLFDSRTVFRHGLAVLRQSDDEEKTARWRGLHGVVDEAGNWVIGPERANFEVALPDRFIKKVYQEHFDSEECKADCHSLASQFVFLLRDYDLIGMTRAELVDLIGSPESDDYCIGPNDPLHPREDLMRYTLGGFGSGCGNAYTCLEFKLQNNIVHAWRKSSFNSGEALWIEQNMEIDWHDGSLRVKNSRH